MDPANPIEYIIQYAKCCSDQKMPSGFKHLKTQQMGLSLYQIQKKRPVNKKKYYQTNESIKEQFVCIIS